jgi:D-lactate dehydrogenase (cytochrome)
VVEFYDEAVLSLVAERKKNISALKVLSDFPKGAAAAVYTELWGNDSDVLEAHLTEHLDLFVKAGGNEENAWAADTEFEIDRFRALRHGIPELLNAEVDRVRLEMPAFTKIGVDFMASSADPVDYLASYHRDIAESGVRGFVFGHILMNHLHVNLLPEKESQLIACQELVLKWAEQIIRAGGQLAAENGVGKLKRHLVRKFLPPEEAIRLDQIRQAFAFGVVFDGGGVG